jgi:hypothetical protein
MTVITREATAAIDFGNRTAKRMRISDSVLESGVQVNELVPAARLISKTTCLPITCP